MPEQNGGSRQRIIEAATSHFVREGYKATSIKAIATDVGISPPAIYWHFDSKQDLFLASMEYLLDAFVDSVEASITADEPESQLRQFVRAHVLWKLEQREEAGAYTSSIGMRDLVHSLPPKHRRALISKQRRHLDTLRHILEDGVARGTFRVPSVRVTSFSILTMCEYVQTWYDPDGDLSPEDIAELYADLVGQMVGIAPVDAPCRLAAVAPGESGRRSRRQAGGSASLAS